MCVLMPPQINFSHKRDSAVLTREWLEPLMLPTVRDQIGRLTEGLATKTTLMRFLPCVDVGVFLHIGFLVESLATELALERARVRMN